VPSARFFVIKSYSEDDIHKSIKYNIWASTDSGNRKLDAAYKQSASLGPIYLFFSVNASGQFCGMAQMTSDIDYAKKCEYWELDKWKGSFSVLWIFIKDIPNPQFRHIRLTNNENKPVTNSRDAQEVFLEPGKEVLKIFATYQQKTSLLDDFDFYDKRQEEKAQGLVNTSENGQQLSEMDLTHALVPYGDNKKPNYKTTNQPQSQPPELGKQPAQIGPSSAKLNTEVPQTGGRKTGNNLGNTTKANVNGKQQTSKKK